MRKYFFHCSSYVSQGLNLTLLRPHYTTGHAINIGVLCMSLILSITAILYCTSENRKRATGQRDSRLAEGDEGTLGYRHPRFKYTI